MCSLQTPLDVQRRCKKETIFLLFLCPILPFFFSPFICSYFHGKGANKTHGKAKKNQTNKPSPMLLARLWISIHLKLTSCWAALEQSIRCHRPSPPVCLLLSLIWNVINGQARCDLLGLVIKASLHGV